MTDQERAELILEFVKVALAERRARTAAGEARLRDIETQLGLTSEHIIGEAAKLTIKR